MAQPDTEISIHAGWHEETWMVLDVMTLLTGLLFNLTRVQLSLEIGCAVENSIKILNFGLN